MEIFPALTPGSKGSLYRVKQTSVLHALELAIKRFQLKQGLKKGYSNIYLL